MLVARGFILQEKKFCSQPISAELGPVRALPTPLEVFWSFWPVGQVDNVDKGLQITKPTNFVDNVDNVFPCVSVDNVDNVFLCCPRCPHLFAWEFQRGDLWTMWTVWTPVLNWWRTRRLQAVHDFLGINPYI